MRGLTRIGVLGLVSGIAGLLATLGTVTVAFAAWDLQTRFTAPVNLPNGEAPADQAMTITVEVKNNGPDASPTVRLRLFRYDHTCGGSGTEIGTYQEVGALSGGGSTSKSFMDSAQNRPTGTPVCYKTGLSTSTGGYYTDSNNNNHVTTQSVKYVTAAATSQPMTVALSVSPRSDYPQPCPYSVGLSAQVSGGPIGATTYQFITYRMEDGSLTGTRNFEASPQWTWSPPGAGRYKLRVIARRQGAPNALTDIDDYRIRLPVSVTTSPASPASAPGRVTITASAVAACVPANTTLTYIFQIYRTSPSSPTASQSSSGGGQDSNQWTTPNEVPAGTHTLNAFVFARKGTTNWATGRWLERSYQVQSTPTGTAGTTTGTTGTPTGTAGTTVSFTRDLYPIYSHIRCVNCHGRVDPIATGRNHGAVGAVGSSACSTCHTARDWKNTGAQSFWAGSGNQTTAKSANEICTIVKNSPQAQSRTSFLAHVKAAQDGDPRIAWSFAPTDPQGSPQGSAPGGHANFEQKSMAWFDGGKPCP